MKVPHTIPEFRSWLRAKIAAMDGPFPEDTLPLCEAAAQSIKHARRIAIALELPAVAAVCEKVTTPALALPVAQRVLAECLAALPNSDTLTVKDAASRLNVSQRTVYDLVRSGRLRSTRIGNGRGTIRIAPADLSEIRKPGRSLRHL